MGVMSFRKKYYEEEDEVIIQIPNALPERTKPQFFDLSREERDECRTIIEDMDFEFVADPLEHVENLTEEEWNNCYSMYAQAQAYNIYDVATVLHTLVRSNTDLYVRVLAKYMGELKHE